MTNMAKAAERKAMEIKSKVKDDITKSHLRKVIKEHHKIGKMLGNNSTNKKALVEHHGLGSLIGMFTRGLSSIGGALARNAKNIGHAVNAGGSLAQMYQANRANAAQERIMNAQAQGLEDQNNYYKSQMGNSQYQRRGGMTKCGTPSRQHMNALMKAKMEESQMQKKGGRTKSHKKHCK